MISHDFLNRPSTRCRRRGLWPTLLTAGLAASLFLPSCGKKPEPPPPPPPPPPQIVVPDPVDIQAIRQELGADARVQIARGVETTERDIAEAVIRFANAWAKGDANALRPMLARGDRAILDDLRSRGEWESEVRKIEQVRVVYLNQDGVRGEAAPAEMTPEQMEAMMQQVREQARQLGLSAGMEAALQMTPEQRAQMMAAAQSGGGLDAIMQQFASMPGGEAFREQLQGLVAGAMAGPTVDGPVVTLALQQPGGAYVLAWNLRGTPGNYTFASLHTVDAVRRRASEWDGRPGLAGAVMPDLAAGSSETQTPGSAPAPEEGGAEEPGRTPGRKATPAGPLTIPGG
jgi:hypothetical protein